MDEKKELLLAIGYNLALAAVMATIILGGLALSGRWDGLWALLLILMMATKSKDRDEKP